MDPAALTWLVAKGIAVAAIPLAYVALSRDPAKFRKLAWVTAFLTLDLIMFGSFTRLTDSGLGCPDWPGCYGHSNPLSAGEPIRAAESAQPTGPVTMTKAWIEMLHRYFAMGIGLLIIILAVQAWRRFRTDATAPSPWLATAALVWVCVQGAFGDCDDEAAADHRRRHHSSDIACCAAGSGRSDRPVARDAPPAAPGCRGPVVVIQIALGGWVSSNYAVLACTDFPRCQGAWIPPMDFEHGFTLWRALGMTGDGEVIPFQALVAIHWVHRAFALVVVAVVAGLIWHAWSLVGLARVARALLAILLLQLITGLSNIVLEWPLLAAVLHSGGAAMLVALLVVANVRAARAGGR
jgi:cytochrome c oxidase assembly protein subunit 15